MASSPLPFSVLEGERSIVECALPYLDIERERPLYPVTYLTKEGRFFLSLATQRAFLLKTSLCSLKRLSLFRKRLRLSLETNVEKDEADLALLYETSSEEKSALIYFRERPQEEQGIAEEAGQKTVEIEGQKGEAKAENKEIQEEKERTSKEKRGFYQFTETLSLGSAPLKRSSWIPALFVSTKEGEEVALPIHMSYPQRFFYNYLYKGRYRRKGRFLYPVNTDEGTLSFQYRPIEKEDRLPFHLKELLALVLYRLRKRHYDKQHIQLIFERNSQSARENGFYYFMHCLENGEEEKENVKLYYVIGENSNDLPRLAPYMDHVVYYESLRHMICLIAAKLLVTTDNRFHVYPKRSRGSLLLHYLRKKPVVFLQHGVTALKRIDGYGKNTPRAASLFVVASEKEKAIIKEHLGYKDSEIANTGFPRFDILTDQSEGKRDIVIMPTWRSWMDDLSPAEFYQSTYYRSYMSLLNSLRLSRLLEEEDLTVSFHLHPRFRKYIHSFASISPRVHLIPYGEVDSYDLIMGCKLLITDYSSVCWDALYLGKPVLFFQFDRPHYLLENGSYLDMTTELPGECAFTASDMVMLLKDYVQAGFCLKEPYASMQKEYFPAPDKENTSRVLAAICKRWHTSPKKGGER